MKNKILVGASLLLMVFCYWQGCQDGKRSVPAPVIATAIKGDSIPVTKWIVKTHTINNHDTLTVATENHDTTIVRVIDSVLIASHVTELTAHTDTVTHGDTVSLDYNYADHTFGFDIKFPPRPTPKPKPTAMFVTVDVDLNEQVFAGVGMRWKVLGIEGYALVGFQRSPFEATAHAGIRIEF